MNAFTVNQIAARKSQTATKTKAEVTAGQSLWIIKHTSGLVFYYAYTTEEAAKSVVNKFLEVSPNLTSNFVEEYGSVTNYQPHHLA